MKTFWVLIAYSLMGFSLSDKLDRTYLPPPGSKFSGGSPGAIDVPLDNSNEPFLTDLGNTNLGKPDIAIGIDRFGPTKITEKYGTSSPYPKNIYSISMTESYVSPETSFSSSASTTGRPDVSIQENFTLVHSNNYEDLYKTSSQTLEPVDVYSSVNKKQQFNEDNTLTNIPSDKYQILNSKISDERENSFNGSIDGVPKKYSYLSEIYSTSSPDHTLLNNYKTGSNINHSTLSLLPNNLQNDSNFILSTPTYDFLSNSPKKSYSSKSSKYTPIPDLNIKTPNIYTSQKERIRAQIDREAVILNYDNKMTTNGYAYSFDTSNGIHVQEEGTELNGIRATGSYSYIGDDGKLYNVSYTADENGFRPYGAHLPTAPSIPDAILRVIEKAAKDREAGIYDDGSYDDNKYGYKKYEPDNKIRFLHKYKTSGSDHKIKRPYFSKLKDNGSKMKSENEKTLTTKKEMEIKRNNLTDITPINISSYHDYKSGVNKYGHKVNEFESKLLDNNIKNSKMTYDMLSTKDSYETEYQNLKPNKDVSLITEDKLSNRISEIPSPNSDDIIFKKMDDNTSVKPFITPYVYQNDNTFLDYDNDDSFLNKPGRNQEPTKIVDNDQSNILSLPAFKKLKTDPTSSIKKNDGSISIKSSDDQGYYYPRKEYDVNDYIYNTVGISKQTNLPEDSSTTSKEITSRFNLMETSTENILIISSANDFAVANDKTQTTNSLLNIEDELKYLPTNSPNNYFEDVAGPTKEANEIGFIDNDKNSIKGENFSSSKHEQKYDPLNGYYYY